MIMKSKSSATLSNTLPTLSDVRASRSGELLRYSCLTGKRRSTSRQCKVRSSPQNSFTCRPTPPDFVDRIIDGHLASSKDAPDEEARYTFLSALFSNTPDRTLIRSELLNILLAGRDTVASLLSNIIWELPRHASVLSQLRSEIDDSIGAAQPTYEQLKDMKYLRAIVNESQRLYPIVPVNSREALVDAVLPRGGGEDESKPVMVPKGAYVEWHIHSMHRRKDLFGEDADVFRPERWLEPGFRPGWAFLPFSGGPRVCIGQNFALTETMYVVVRLVQGWDVQQRDSEGWREKFSLTCTGAGGCRVGLTPRVW